MPGSNTKFLLTSRKLAPTTLYYTMPVTEKDIANLGANSIASNNTSSSLKKQDNKIITYTESNSSLESDEISKNPF